MISSQIPWEGPGHGYTVEQHRRSAVKDREPNRGANAGGACGRVGKGIVGTWRGLSQKAHAKGADPKLMDDLAAHTKKVEAADVTIREAAKPKKLHFEIEPAK